VGDDCRDLLWLLLGLSDDGTNSADLLSEVMVIKSLLCGKGVVAAKLGRPVEDFGRGFAGVGSSVFLLSSTFFKEGIP